MTQFQNTVILLTGATGGFGQEFTRQLLAVGSRLIVSDRNLTQLQELVQTIQHQVKTGEVIACLESDLANPEGCQSLYQQVQALNIPVEILINNAGIGLFSRFDEVPSPQWEKLIEINLLTPMRLSGMFIPGMIARGQGHIVNISSLAGWVAPAGLAAYGASKFGLRGFSEALWEELRPYNIQVSAVYPFFSRTPILQSPRYGSWAEQRGNIPSAWVTEPAKVIRATLQGIEQNRLHIFPDPQSQIIHLGKRYLPGVLNWLNRGVTKRQKNAH